MMKDILITISKETRMVDLSKSIIGVDSENLQGKLVFKFADEFVNGTARLEYEMNFEKHFIMLKKENESYSCLVKNVLTKEGQINMQLVITESETEQGIPVFKSNVFYVRVNGSINAESEAPEEYQQWLDIANAKLAELDDAIEESKQASEYAREKGQYAYDTAEELSRLAEEGHFDGKDALINGVNAITIEAGKNITIEQEEGKLTINGTDGYDDTEIRQEISNLDIEVGELTDNINEIVRTKADKTEIPDVSEFIKKTVNDLVNYYRKSETYTKQEVNQLIGAIKTISMKIVPERPATGESNVIYLVPSAKSETENIYEEWIYIDNRWELIGSTKIDLSNYYTKDEVNQILFDYITSNDLEEILEDYAKKSQLLEIDNTTITKNSANKIQNVASILQSGGIQKYWKGTKNEFNAITTKDNNTLYEVVDDEETVLFEVDGNTIEFSQDNILQIPAKNDLMFQSITYGNHESGYRKWRNGYLEQWGVATSSANGDAEFTMHQAHVDQNFSVFIEPREQGNFYHYAIPSGNQKFRMRMQTRDSQNIAVKYQWHSYGYWK